VWCVVVPFWRRLLVAQDPPTYVDVEAHERRRLIREAEYQAQVDAQSKVLRVSGKVTGERRRVAAVVDWGGHE